MRLVIVLKELCAVYFEKKTLIASSLEGGG